MASRMDPDLLAHADANPDLGIVPEPSPASLPPMSVLDVRDNFNTVIGATMENFKPISKHIIETKHSIKSHDGAAITVHELARDDWPARTEPTPAVLYFHGGGIVACPVDLCAPSMAAFAGDFGIRVFAVEYRLAPEHPYPTPLEDGYAALRWLAGSAQRLNVNPERIAVLGASGGGNLAAGLALLARDRGHSPPLARQFLFYPMLDDRARERHYDPTISAVDKANEGFRNAVDLCWGAYLGGNIKRGGADVPVYAAPARAEDLSGLPPAYIDVGTIDALRHETIEYAVRLIKADIEVDLHVYEGMTHGFDLSAPEHAATANAKENRRRALRSV
jgi:acetyl esterase/lipase